MLKKLFLTMSLLGLFSVCYGQGTTNPLPAMPQGKLLRVEYAYNGMRIPEYSDFDLKRDAKAGKSEFKFRHYTTQVSHDGAPDSLFTEARRIIEEERMYEYGDSYHLPAELEASMLDGFSWHFDAYFENGVHISSHGRHVLPEGKGFHSLENLLYKAANEIIEATLDR